MAKKMMASLTGGGLARRGGEEQARAAQRSYALQKQMYEEGKGFLEPYREAGLGALQDYQSLLSGDMSAFQESPGYQFQLEQGLGALERGAAARGSLFSGAQQKALMGYGQGLASKEYQNYLSNVGSLLGLGYEATAATTGLGGQFGQMGGQSLQAVGAGRAAGMFGQAQARQQMLSSIGQAGGTAAGIMMLSDKNLKENIKVVGYSSLKIPIVEFNYKGNKKRYRGVIAQDVEKIVPRAVGVTPSGYKGVYYDLIDVNFEEIA